MQIFLPPHLRRAGLVFQDAQLFPHMTVFENISEKQIFFVYKNFLHGFLLDSYNVLTEYMCERLDSNIELEYFERIKNKLVYYPFVYDFSSNFETV